MAATMSSIFVIKFRALPGVDNAAAVRGVRAILKIGLRRFRLRAIDAREVADHQQQTSPGDPATRAPGAISGRT
jgi:hypothetical protein